MLSRRDVLFVLGALPAMTFAAESTAENYDVIVVGRGAAGLSAAVSAAYRDKVPTSVRPPRGRRPDS